MKLITKAVEARLKKFPLKSQDGKGLDAVVVVKFFDPTGRYTFYVTDAEQVVTEVCPYGETHNHEDAANRCLSEVDDWYFFGYCVSALGPDCDEFGSVLLSQLKSIKCRFGLSIERDMHIDLDRTIRQELSN